MEKETVEGVVVKVRPEKADLEEYEGQFYVSMGDIKVELLQKDFVFDGDIVGTHVLISPLRPFRTNGYNFEIIFRSTLNFAPNRCVRCNNVPDVLTYIKTKEGKKKALRELL